MAIVCDIVQWYLYSRLPEPLSDLNYDLICLINCLFDEVELSINIIYNTNKLMQVDGNMDYVPGSSSPRLTLRLTHYCCGWTEDPAALHWMAFSQNWAPSPSTRTWRWVTTHTHGTRSVSTFTVTLRDNPYSWNTVSLYLHRDAERQPLLMEHGQSLPSTWRWEISPTHGTLSVSTFTLTSQEVEQPHFLL